MEYKFREIEAKWQEFWKNNNTYKTNIDKSKPKFYVLDMFPYPSGAGLHVGHPLGYIASDIYSRYKRLCGFNVLHPMGYDAFGLPAEQYAIQTGQHPAVTTDKNIRRYREQLDKIGFSYDWSREFRTCDPSYYKWTQWAFIQMFKHWYNNKTQKAEAIDNLIKEFESNGTDNIDAANTEPLKFSAAEWKEMDEEKKQLTLLNYRLAYLSDSMVNWCPELGTVLANDEVRDGISIRGGHPVEQKLMKQWSLRVSAYAQRLLDGLETVNWSESLKEMQRNWIGRSEGAEMFFPLKGYDIKIKIFTTRPDTIYGCTFMVLSPEHELIKQITTEEYKNNVEAYCKEAAKHTERERMADVKKVTGQFTGAYAINPLNNKEVPIYISEYVLAGYGTGAIMAVPAHDSRDFAFARHFKLPVIQVILREGEQTSDTDTWEESYDSKEGTLINSEIIDGLNVISAIKKITEHIEKQQIGNGMVNYRLRDAIFSRQRYWGEPFPVYYKDGIPNILDVESLPLELPDIDAYLPTEKGEPPLGRAKDWKTKEGYPLELNTMPGFAGSSAYYTRYMDPHNNDALVSKEAVEYWRDVDLYIGGTEHATGHLIYSRYWNKFLLDTGVVVEDEPYKKLINQGMIQGRSNFVYREKNTNAFISKNHTEGKEVTTIHVDVNIVANDVLDIEKFRNWRQEYKDAEFVLEDGKYICGWAIEKMSKSMHNVVNPDDIVEKYGADTLRMYEMFLGPLEQSKPWDTNGIDGVNRFLRKLWRLFHNTDNEPNVSTDKASEAERKILHRTIKKIKDDIEAFSFNTSVSAFMICVNELTDVKCNKKEVLEPLTIILSPFAPHIAEELWQILGNNPTVFDAVFPAFDEKFLVDDTFEYPVAINGKMRFKVELPVSVQSKEIEEIILNHESTVKYLEGKPPKKIIVVHKKIINIVK